MTDDTFRELTGPVNNLGSGALKVGKLQYNFEYFDGVVENQDNQSLRPNSKIIQVDNIQVTGEILFKKNVLDTNGLGYGYGSQKTEVVSLSENHKENNFWYNMLVLENGEIYLVNLSTNNFRKIEYNFNEKDQETMISRWHSDISM